MHPLHVRTRNSAFIADRFLSGMARSLWLVKDGVATTAEIDDAIRYGFGLRWAQMGLFETYRVAVERLAWRILSRNLALVSNGHGQN